MRSEAEFQKIKSQIERREACADALDAEPGDAVLLDGEETWLLTDVIDGRRGPEAHLENWDEMKRVSPCRIEKKY